MQRFVREAVHDDAEAIYTDEAKAYEGVGDDDTRHETVHHRNTLMALVGAEAMPYRELIREKVSESTLARRRRAAKATAKA